MESSAPLNRLRVLWAEDRCALGAIATIPSVQTVQILAASGLDFTIIDMEHGPIGPAEAHRPKPGRRRGTPGGCSRRATQ